MIKTLGDQLTLSIHKNKKGKDKIRKEKKLNCLHVFQKKYIKYLDLFSSGGETSKEVFKKTFHLFHPVAQTYSDKDRQTNKLHKNIQTFNPCKTVLGLWLF